MNNNFRKYDLINKEVDRFLIPILVFFLIIFGRDTLLTNVKYGFYVTQITLVIIFLFLLLFFLYVNRKYILEIIFDIRFFVVLCTFLIIGIQMIVKGDFTLMNFSVILCIAVSFFFTYLKDYKYLLKIFVNSILLLAVYSLVSTYLFRGVIFSNLNSFNIITNSSGSEFIDLFLSFLLNKSDYFRNFSLFREPAVYCYFLIISLILEIFIIERSKKSKYLIAFILCITILTTFSTTGMIVLGMITVLMFLSNYRTILHSKRTILFLLISFFIFIALFDIILSKSTAIYWTVYSMISKVTSINESSFSRFISIPVNLLAFIKSPIFGSKISDVLVLINHNTSTSFSLLAIYGFFGLTNIIIWLFFAFDSFKKKFSKMYYIRFSIFLLIIFIPFNTSNILTNIFFYFIPIVYIVDNSKLVLKMNAYLILKLNINTTLLRKK